MGKEIPPDDASRIFSNADYRRTVMGCDFLLPIDAPDGWFDHQELAGAAIPLELDTAHPCKRHPLEERLR
jgi:hypothetical protein